MTSVLTNAAATAALQTLRAISSDMAEVQSRVSSGFRVQTASDNAAYWSIATTMRSDNKAISAVEDALGLGAAVADTAYTGTSAVVDVLDSFKARLVAAKEDGVDKGKIQEELDQLNSQAESIVASSSFNGVNWLSTDNPSSLAEIDKLETHVVSSFVRSSDGTVAVKRTTVDLKSTSMLNAGGGGILQKQPVGDAVAFASTEMDQFYHYGHEDHPFTGAVTVGAGQSLTFDLAVDYSSNGPGTDHAITIDKAVVDSALGTTDGVIADVSALVLVLQEAFDNAGAAVKAQVNGSAYDIRSLEVSGSGGSSVEISNLASSLTGSDVLGLDTIYFYDHDNMHPKALVDFPGDFTLAAGSTITFDVEIAGSAKTVTIDRATVDGALGTSNGRVASVSDFAAVIDYVADSGLSAAVSGSRVVLTVDQSIYPGYGGLAAAFEVSDFTSDIGSGVSFDLAEVDITDDSFTIDEYISGVEYMLQKAISGASLIGSLQSRIDLQTNFAAKLSDSIDTGVGRLVDADMNEASTRLRALETQQQLAIQSLSIANTSADAILQLYRQ